MNFLELSNTRKSVRKYVAKAVEQDKIDYIMESVRVAPSAVNFQPWFFFLIKSEEGIAKIKNCYPKEWFTNCDAPVYLLACADTSKSWKRRHDNKDHGDIDVAIAFEHLCLAAADQGLGTCWICAFDPKTVIEQFELPEHLVPIAITPLGYPEDTAQRIPARKLLEEICKEV